MEPLALEGGALKSGVLPFFSTETMALHLAKISLIVTPEAHAVVLMELGQIALHRKVRHHKLLQSKKMRRS